MERDRVIQQLMTEGNQAMERRDFNNAEAKFLAAAEMGSVGALFNLGWLEKEHGNTVRSIMFFLDAALRDDVDAMVQISSIYEALGEMEKAIGWLKRAQELGSRTADFALGRLESDPDWLEKFDDDDDE